MLALLFVERNARGRVAVHGGGFRGHVFRHLAVVLVVVVLGRVFVVMLWWANFNIGTAPS